MRVVDVAEFYSERGGGVRTYIHQKLEHGQALGVDVTVIAPGEEDRVEPRAGGRVVWLRSPALPFDPNYRRFAFAGADRAVAEVLDRIRPQVVEASSTWKGGWIAAGWRGPALKALFLHQDPVAVYPQALLDGRLAPDRIDQAFGWFWAYLDRLSRAFDTAVVSGQWLSDKLARLGARGFAAVPLGVDKARFAAARPDPGLRREMLAACGLDPDAGAPALAVAVSRHHPEKRIPTLIAAAARLGRGRPLGLYIIGEGPDRRTVERLAARTPGVFVAGLEPDRDRLARRLASADFFLHGGAAETFGLAVAEALAAGLPWSRRTRAGRESWSAPAGARPTGRGTWTAASPPSSGCWRATSRGCGRRPARRPSASLRRGSISNGCSTTTTRRSPAGTSGLRPPPMCATLRGRAPRKRWRARPPESDLIAMTLLTGGGILARARDFAAGPTFKRALGWFEVLLGMAAAGYLAWRLSHIGWVEVAKALPTSPLFYLLFLPRLFAIPVSELFIYQRLWAMRLIGCWRPFLKKLAYNFGFLEYTGELYFAGWAPRALSLPARTVLASLRDVNILSALIANVATALLFSVLFLTGQVRRLLQTAPDIAPYFIIAGVFIFTITLAGLMFRKRLIGLETRDAAFVAGLHLVRVVGMVLLQAAQWWVAIPSAPFGVWLVFLTTNMMLTRVPLLPSRELVFAGISLELLDLVAAPEAKVAATFASSAALMQLGYMALLVLTTVWRRRRSGGSPPSRPT